MKEMQMYKSLGEVVSMLNYGHASSIGQAALVIYPSAEGLPQWLELSRLAEGQFNFVAIADCRRIKPDAGQPIVAMVDMEKPGAVEEVPRVVARELSCRISDVVLLCYSRNYSLKSELAAVQLRANGYWAWNLGNAECLQALRLLRRGKSYFTNEAVSLMLRRKEGQTGGDSYRASAGFRCKRNDLDNESLSS